MGTEKLNPPGIVQIARSLEEELAQKIKEREEKIVKTTLEHAKIQGEDLLRAQQHLGEGKFNPWLEATFPFTRQTAYKYMRIARHWDAICKRRLHLTNMEEVFRELFGKAKSQTKRASSPDAQSTSSEPKSSRSQDAEPNPVTVRVKKIEAADATRVAAEESAAADRTSQQQPPLKQADMAGDEDHAESQEPKGNEAPTQVQRPNPAVQDDAGDSHPKNALVMPVKDPRVNEYYRGLYNELLDRHRKKGNVFCVGIFPEHVREIMKKEDISVQLFLGVVQLRISIWEDLAKNEESTKDQKNTKATSPKRKVK